MKPIWSIADEQGCGAFSATFDLIATRWTPGILRSLAHGATRFSEVRALVPGLSDRMLAQRLRQLEAHRMITREVEPTMPVTIRYRLTPRGEELMGALEPLLSFGSRWMHAERPQDDEIPRTA